MILKDVKYDRSVILAVLNKESDWGRKAKEKAKLFIYTHIFASPSPTSGI